LEDYGLPELDTNGNRNLFHPEAWPFLPRSESGMAKGDREWRVKPRD
jgi:hypothetical protein